MALEYNFSLNERVNTLDLIQKFKKQESFEMTSINNDGGFSIDLWDVDGFVLTGYFKKDKYFEYTLDGEIVIDEYQTSSELNFRLNKEYDNVQAKLNMIQLIVFILDKTLANCRLMFLSDALVLERTSTGIFLNNDFDFWNSLNVDDLFSKQGLSIID